MRKYIAEFIGTFILVLFGTGVAVLTGDVVATSLAFGLSIVAAAYAVGHVSGCHINPAVSFAMLLTRRMSFKDFLGYVVFQIAGAFAGTGLLYYVLRNLDQLKDSKIYEITTLGANGYGTLSQYGTTLICALVVEIALTFVFVHTVLAVTKDETKSAVAPYVIGGALTLVHFLGITFTGTSVNPARSISPAVLLRVLSNGTVVEPLKQLWVFIVGPLIGAAIAACVYLFLNTRKKTVAKAAPVETKVVKKTTKKKSK